MKVELIQTQLSALKDKVIDKTVIGSFKSKQQALDFLEKRGYKFYDVDNAYVAGNTRQFPVVMKVTEYNMFDIRSFTA
tara:strand:+ start:156 stop:389 length:234 start_codon:yes stop_codon:yes gene_type:complete